MKFCREDQDAVPSVSVIIPTFNGQRFLGGVLASLASQTLPAAKYEVVVVDNNSTIDLFAGPGTAQALDALRDKGVTFQCVPESRQGLTFARIGGVNAARAPVICFLDDDNEPVPDYLEVGLGALADSAVGLLVSRVYPAYEKPPRPAIRRREHLFAINHPMGDRPVRWRKSEFCPSLGAGLWVRKPAFEKIYAIDPQSLLPDRSGSNLISGGDIEIGIGIGELGFDRLYLPNLIVKHHIPIGRLTCGYMRRLIRGIVRSKATIDHRYFDRRDSKLASLIGLVGCVTAGWIVALRRGDALCEYQFMVTAAYSRFEGPFLRGHS